MNSATIFIKTEPKIKEEAQKTAAALGFSLSSIINAYLRQFVKTKAISFSAGELDEVPNEYFKQEARDAKKHREMGKASPVFETAEEMRDWLHKQGV